MDLTIRFRWAIHRDNPQMDDTYTPSDNYNLEPGYACCISFQSTNIEVCTTIKALFIISSKIIKLEDQGKTCLCIEKN